MRFQEQIYTQKNVILYALIGSDYFSNLTFEVLILVLCLSENDHVFGQNIYKIVYILDFNSRACIFGNIIEQRPLMRGLWLTQTLGLCSTLEMRGIISEPT